MFILFVVIGLLFFCVGFLLAFAVIMSYAALTGRKKPIYQFSGTVDTYVPTSSVGYRAIHRETADGHSGRTEYKKPR